MSIARPQPTVLGTAPEAIERALQLLREEWRDGFAGRKIDRVRMLLRQAQNLTGDTALSITLARLDLRLEGYPSLDSDGRKI